MMKTLHEPVRTSDPADEVRDASRARGPRGKTSFQLASRGGYVRTVTGTVAFFDAEAETYMVLADGELLRVPLRDITSLREESAEPDGSSERDAEGLGTG